MSHCIIFLLLLRSTNKWETFSPRSRTFIHWMFSFFFGTTGNWYIQRLIGSFCWVFALENEIDFQFEMLQENNYFCRWMYLRMVANYSWAHVSKYLTCCIMCNFLTKYFFFFRQIPNLKRKKVILYLFGTRC